jgi:hypothetical protein
LATFKPAIIEVTYRPLRDLVDAGAHIMFEDLNGLPLLGIDSKDFQEMVRARAGQQICCKFFIESLPLNPGPFRLRLWLRSHSDHIHWEVPKSFDVGVEETLVYGTRATARHAHGVTAARAKVTIEAS